MPVETRSLRRSGTAATKPRPHSTQPATATNPSSARIRKRKNASAAPNIIKELQAELGLAIEQTKSLEDVLRDIVSRLKEAQSNLGIAKKHHQAAMEQARESKRIICRYLALGMDIPPCKSLDLPMEVYSDESNHKLAEMIKEQEKHISKLKKNADELQGQIELGRKDVRRVKRKIYTQQVNMRNKKV